MKKLLALVMASLLAATFVACGDSGEEEVTCDNLPDGKIKQECLDKAALKAEGWDRENRPEAFGVELKYNVSELPQTGRVERLAWPADYWATYKDSVNHRWQGRNTLSPLEKFDKAFHGWTPPEGFMDLKIFQGCGDDVFDDAYYEGLGPAAKYWSSNKGNRAQRDIMRRGDTQGECEEVIETWFGLCHAWVPAAILEPEPQKAVEYNGVTFEVSDMKALMLMMYDRSSTRFLGTRCNLRDEDIKRDEHGRIIQSECRDTNVGSLHLLLANLIGIDKRAFAEDRTMNYQVWNQPVIGYRFEVMEEIDEAQATKLLIEDCGVDCSYPYNDEAKRWFEVLAEVDYITESSPDTQPKIPEIDRFTRTDKYHYVLECDANGDVIGGEWISSQVTAFPDRINYPPDSQDAHPDFLWLPLRAGYSSNPHATLENVRMLVRMSEQTNPDPTGDVKEFKSEASHAIPDNDAAGVVSAIEVADDLNIKGIKVAVNISHTYVGDLTITLRHNGEERTLQRNAGGSQQDLQKTFEVDGIAGSAAGTWELQVVDSASRDTGEINEWRLIVMYGEGGGTGGNAETYSSNSTLAIPDNTPAGIESAISVPGSGAVKSLKVRVDISHTWASDLNVTLNHGSVKVPLHSREGDDTDDIKKTFTVDEFNGVDSGGEWILKVSDHAGSDEGMLNSWSIEVER